LKGPACDCTSAARPPTLTIRPNRPISDSPRRFRFSRLRFGFAFRFLQILSFNFFFRREQSTEPTSPTKRRLDLQVPTSVDKSSISPVLILSDLPPALTIRPNRQSQIADSPGEPSLFEGSVQSLSRKIFQSRAGGKRTRSGSSAACTDHASIAGRSPAALMICGDGPTDETWCETHSGGRERVTNTSRRTQPSVGYTREDGMGCPEHSRGYESWVRTHSRGRDPWVRHTQKDATWCWPRSRGRDRVSGPHSGVCWTRSRVLDTVEGVLDTVTGVRHGSA